MSNFVEDRKVFLYGKNGERKSFILRNGVPSYKVLTKKEAYEIALIFEGSLCLFTSEESLWFYEHKLEAIYSPEKERKPFKTFQMTPKKI